MVETKKAGTFQGNGGKGRKHSLDIHLNPPPHWKGVESEPANRRTHRLLHRKSSTIENIRSFPSKSFANSEEST